MNNEGTQEAYKTNNIHKKPRIRVSSGTQVLNCFAEIPTSYTVSLSLSACFSASSLPFP